jgi:TonB family protein
MATGVLERTASPMFLEFYKLNEQPFSETPDPRFVYLSATHREALASLFYGIETGRGFLALIAEPGMGKTTLLFHVLEQLRSSSRTAFLFQTQCDSRELVRSLLADLGIETGRRDLAWMHDQLKRVVINEASAGRRLVVFIDETQNLTESALETVRLLSDFETPTSKLMQIVLAGQPQLADKLASPALVQLRQRVSILSHLDRFTPAETDAYISHRLRVAGYKGGPLFTPEARAMIAARSKGIPRTINIICFNALGLGYALGKKEIDGSLVKEAANDLEVRPLGSERHDRAFATQPQRGKATVSEAVQQVSSVPTSFVPDLGKSGSITPQPLQSLIPVEMANVSSHESAGCVTDSLPAVTISHERGDSSSRQKWVRALSLIGQQVPTMPSASEPATLLPQAVSSSAVVEPAERESKTLSNELPSKPAASSKAGRALPTALNSATLVPEPARLRPALQESATVAETETVVFDLEAQGTDFSTATPVFPARSYFRLKQTWRMAFPWKANHPQLLRWWALAAICGLLAVASGGILEAVRRQGTPSVSPVATPKTEAQANPQALTAASPTLDPPREKPDPPMVSSASSAPRKSKSKRVNSDSALLDRSLEPERASATTNPSDNPNVTSRSIASLASSGPITPEPAPKSQQAQEDKFLEPSYLLYRVEPAYPRDAQEQDVEGTVKMRALIGPDGRVRRVELLSGPPLLVSAAMSAARQWRFVPAILNGQPVESEEEITIDFRLGRGSLRGDRRDSSSKVSSLGSYEPSGLGMSKDLRTK